MWVRFDDQTPDDPDIDALSDGAFRLWFAAICYASGQGTDGRLPARIAPRLTPNYRPSHLKELTTSDTFSGRSILTLDGDSYQIRSFTKYNPTSEEAQALSDSRGASGSLGAHRRWHVGKGVYKPDCEWCRSEGKHNVA